MGAFVEKCFKDGTLVDTGGLDATEFMELHRKHWPGFEGESEVRPIEEFAHP